MNKYNDIALVAHDAGGAQIVSLWAKDLSCNTLSVVEGPACSIFSINLKDTEYLQLEVALQRCDLVVTATSWQSDLEKQAIRLARSLNKKSISILDHWCNYEERFILDGVQVLPDKIMVVDEYAFHLATLAFKGAKIDLIENPYLKMIDSEIHKEKLSLSDKIDAPFSILYICESIDAHAASISNEPSSVFGYLEKDSYQYFLENINKLYPDIYSLTIRPHPSQTSKSVRWMLECSSILNVEVSNRSTLVRQVLAHDIIVGMSSMAMVVALRAQKPTISCIPPNCQPCLLPFKEIIHLSEI